MADYQLADGVKPASGRAIRDVRQLAMDEMSRSPRPEQSLKIDHSFPEKFVDELSRREVFNKHLFRPNTYLHKWWARRCGSMFRAILKQFVPNTERQDYYTAGGLEGKVVLDPMMGWGHDPSRGNSVRGECNWSRHRPCPSRTGSSVTQPIGSGRFASRLQPISFQPIRQPEALLPD